MKRLKIFFGRSCFTAGLILAFGGMFSSADFGNYFVNSVWAKAKPKTALKISQKKKKKNTATIKIPIFPVKITGNTDCISQTNAALVLLQKKSPVDYEKTSKNIGSVECAEKGSGVFVWENPPRFKVGRATYQADVVWYASAFLHEACHVEEYQHYLSYHPDGNVPSEIFSGSDAENQCLFEQYNCLVRLGASQSFLDYTKKIAETSYWNIPAGKRWW